MKQILLCLAITGLFTACQVENINYTPPIMVTYEPQSVLATSASLGGAALGNGGLKVTEYGIVYNTAGNPTINDTKIALGENLGEFYETFDVFEPGKTYSYRTYGINSQGTGYGETYNFTTASPPPCNPVNDNFIDNGLYTVTINDVNIQDASFPATTEFVTSGYNNTSRIYLTFNEINGRLPLTGTYETVIAFDSVDPRSDGKIVVSYSAALGWEQTGAIGVAGEKVYIENENGKITFIFCDYKMSQYFTLNGKFTYTE